jgi:hypothetical protein
LLKNSKMPKILSTIRFSKIYLTLFVVAFAAIGGYLVFSSFAAGSTANLWIDSNGGSCSRGSGTTYSDAAACADPNSAYAAAQCGDTIRIINGTYSSFTLNAASKNCTSSSLITFRPQDDTPNSFNESNPFVQLAPVKYTGNLNVTSSYVQIMDIDTKGVNVNPSLNPQTNYVTFVRVNAIGDGSTGGQVFIGANNITWLKGSAGGFNACLIGDVDGFRLWGSGDGTSGTGYGPTNDTVDGIILHDITNSSGGGYCAQHTDAFQMFGGTNDTIQNLRAYNVNVNSTGIIMRPQSFTCSGKTCVVPLSNITVQNNMLKVSTGGNAIVGGGTNDQCSGMVIRNNTISQNATISCTGSGNVMTNNILSGCVSGGNYTSANNVFLGTVTCGSSAYKCTPTWADPNTTRGDYHLASSDTCAKGKGGTLSFASLDYDGNSRSAAAIDIGADQYSSGGSSSPPSSGGGSTTPPANSSSGSTTPTGGLTSSSNNNSSSSNKTTNATSNTSGSVSENQASSSGNQVNGEPDSSSVLPSSVSNALSSISPTHGTHKIYGIVVVLGLIGGLGFLALKTGALQNIKQRFSRPPKIRVSEPPESTFSAPLDTFSPTSHPEDPHKNHNP